MPRVRTPRIYWEATKRRVLTMEWIEGVKLTNKVSRRVELVGCVLAWLQHTWDVGHVVSYIHGLGQAASAAAHHRHPLRSLLPY